MLTQWHQVPQTIPAEIVRQPKPLKHNSLGNVLTALNSDNIQYIHYTWDGYQNIFNWTCKVCHESWSICGKFLPRPSNHDPTESPTFQESPRLFNDVQQWENIEDAYSIPLQFKREAIILEAHLIFPFWGCITPWAHRWWRRWKQAGSSLKPGSATSHKCKCYDLNSTTVNAQALCNSGHWQMQTNLTQLKMEINNI